jgi:hypothetical protein
LGVRRASPIAALLAGLGGPIAHAQDRFEIQVYDGTADEPGVAGLELHLNDWLTGRRDRHPPEAALHGQFHATLEPSLGILPFWEIGAYVQFAARTDDGVFDWAGVKARSKWVTPPHWDRHARLGLNLEVSYVPSTYDMNRWGMELRPIVAWQNSDWLFALNPILEQALASPGAASGPLLSPALKVARSVGPVALGFEYFASIGPLASPMPLRAQDHEVFEVVDVTSWERFELNLGVGEGLTPASAGITVKAIFGVELETSTIPAPLQASKLGR